MPVGAHGVTRPTCQERRLPAGKGTFSFLETRRLEASAPVDCKKQDFIPGLRQIAIKNAFIGQFYFHQKVHAKQLVWPCFYWDLFASWGFNMIVFLAQIFYFVRKTKTIISSYWCFEKYVEEFSVLGSDEPWHDHDFAMKIYAIANLIS